MVATTSQAYVDLHNVIEAAWFGNTDTADIPIYYWDDEKDLPKYEDNTPGADTEYIHIMFSEVAGGQATLQNNVGSRRDRLTGLLTINIYTIPGDFQRRSSLYTDVLLAGLRRPSVPHCLEFLNMRPNPLGRQGNRFVTQVLCTVRYDTLS